MIQGMKLLCPLLLSMSLCLAETQVKPEMTRHAFLSRYAQMNQEALSLPDVDFLRRAYELGFDRCEYYIEGFGGSDYQLLYYTLEKEPLAVLGEYNEKPHYLIRVAANRGRNIPVYREINEAYLFDVEAQVYRRMEGPYPDLVRLVNKDFFAYLDEINRQYQPILLNWIRTCQREAKACLSSKELEAWMAMSPEGVFHEHLLADHEFRSIHAYQQDVGLAGRPDSVILVLELLWMQDRVPKREVFGGTEILSSIAKCVCYRYDKKTDCYVHDASVKVIPNAYMEPQPLPISEKNFESLRPDLSE